MKAVIHIIFAIPMLMAVASPRTAHAQEGQASDRPYSISGFSGACKSVGMWTREALQLTNEIRSFTMQLKDDPNCKALGERVQKSLQGLASNVAPKVAERHSKRMSQLRQEFAALTTYIRTGGGTGRAENALMRTVVQDATMSAHIQNSGAGLTSESTTESAIDGRTPLDRLGDRFTSSARDGLSMFNDVVDSIPQMQQCLTGDGVAGGNIIATSVKLLTSFVSSGQDQTGTSVATALSKLSQVMRETKFANVLTKLNQADVMSSIACLIEISTENYCTTRDSKLLFDDMMKQLQGRPRENEQKRLGSAHTLAGYYILTQNIPIITNWIQRVQIGVDPRVPTDADFQNRIFDEVNNFYKQTKVLRGYMSKEIEAMKTAADLKSKQNYAREIVQHVTAVLGGGFDTAGSKNFFTMNGSPRELMFLLLKIPMPKEVTGAGGGMAQEPSQWLENNYMTEPIFQDPDRLVLDVMNRIFNEDSGMIATAQRNAIQYYNKWFIIDKISLVNESLLGMNYNVKDSLKLINDYLGEVEKRMRANSNDLSIIGGLRDTRTKIKNVLHAYSELERVITSLPKDSSQLTSEEYQKVTAANIAIITSVYDEFEVLLGKSGYFANRVGKFVYQDYVNMLRTRKDFSDNVSDLAYAAGLTIFDRLMATAENNPANVQNDLASAMTLNKMNLEAIEILVRDYFANMTAELQAVSTASKTGAKFENRPIKPDGASRAWRDNMVTLPGQEQPKKLEAFGQRLQAGWKFWSQAASSVPGLDFVFGGDPKYTKMPDRLARFAIDDEFGSAQRLFEQFCIQSLAFSDVRSFYSICQGVVLKSPFPEPVLVSLQEKERRSLLISYKEKLSESRDNAPLNLSQRICAFRDYNRKNMVVYLTTAQKNSAP